MNAAPTHDVSRETIEQLKAYESLVRKWNPRINLVSRASLEDFWNRHIEDSVQICAAASDVDGDWLDIGSGGGMPGIVAAILAKQQNRSCRVTLVESDQRKAAFLRNCGRELGLGITVLSQRIEEISAQNAQILSARALAPLAELLGFAELHLARSGTAIFPKGAKYRQEIEAARAEWNFSVEELPSATDNDASILRIGEISRV